MLGNLLNGLMWIPYQTQLAHGWTSLTVRINIVAVAVIVPAILWATPRYGAEGAAWVWLVLNTGYLLVGIHFMYGRILSAEKRRWYAQDLLLPLGAALLSAGTLALLWPAVPNNLADLMLLTLAAGMTLTAALLAGNHTRNQLRHWLHLYAIKWKTAHGH